MKNPLQKKRVTTDDLAKAIRLKKRQLAFDKYPKPLQDFLTREGMNPYNDDVESRIQYRDFTVDTERN